MLWNALMAEFYSTKVDKAWIPQLGPAYPKSQEQTLLMQLPDELHSRLLPHTI